MVILLVVIQAFVTVALSELPQIETDFLLDFYKSTNGLNWNNPWNFSQIFDDPCSLLYVTCDQNDTHIIKFYVNKFNNLVGSIQNNLYTRKYLLFSFIQFLFVEFMQFCI